MRSPARSRASSESYEAVGRGRGVAASPGAGAGEGARIDAGAHAFPALAALITAVTTTSRVELFMIRERCVTRVHDVMSPEHRFVITRVVSVAESRSQRKRIRSARPSLAGEEPTR